MSCSFATGEKGVSLPPSTESANVDLFMTIENLFVTSVFMCVFVLCFFHSLVFFCPFYVSLISVFLFYFLFSVLVSSPRTS